MVSAEQLERVLRDFNFTYGSLVAGILTRTGAPIAIQANAPVEAEHFATMAATLVGSLDVMYRGVGLEAARTLAVETGNGLLVVAKVGRDTLFVALGPADSDLVAQREEALARLHKVLEPLQPLDKFVA